ncbi:Peroxidase 19 [Triticum urartu]|uniref:Peroxidase n=1 Tax=Triticum urartu TaxID=4572 RepID=M7YJD2_TRIUA|nr:Peroxidase 19 [Triticum urartu]
MGSSVGIRFRSLVLLLVAYLGGMRAREAPLPLPSARSAGVNNRRAPERHGLSLDFYGKTCPAVDHIVANVTAERFRDHPATGPAVLRLFHHDCFVEVRKQSSNAVLHRICIHIAQFPHTSKATGEKVERDMEENRNLPQYGFDTVEMAKAAVESKCPGVVSCADILALAARDAVQLAGGPYYEVKKGRKDSKVSLAGKARLGVLGSDQALFLDARTRPLVQDLGADKARFFRAFVASMDRMGSIRVKKGKKGEDVTTSNAPDDRFLIHGSSFTSRCAYSLLSSDHELDPNAGHIWGSKAPIKAPNRIDLIWDTPTPVGLDINIWPTVALAVLSKL